MGDITESGAISMFVNGPTGTLSRTFGWNCAHGNNYKIALESMYNYDDKEFYYLEEIQNTTEERETHDATYYRATFIDGKYICEIQQPHMYGIICSSGVKEITNDEIDIWNEKGQKVFIIREVKLTNRGKDLAKQHIDEQNKINKQQYEKRHNFSIYYKDKILNYIIDNKFISVVLILAGLLSICVGVYRYFEAQ